MKVPAQAQVWKNGKHFTVTRNSSIFKIITYKLSDFYYLFNFLFKRLDPNSVRLRFLRGIFQVRKGVWGSRTPS